MMTLREAIDRTHKHGVAVKNQIVRLTRLEKALEALNRRRRAQLPHGTFTMYDSITISEIPKGAEAVAGYVGGKWPTYTEMVKAFPHAKHLSIAVNASEDAECLDIETGDATPAQAAAWVKRQVKRGVHRPVVYANTSTMPSVLAALAKAKISRETVRVWTAHYTGTPHIEPGSDATQWTDKALGRNLDASLCKGDFL